MTQDHSKPSRRAYIWLVVIVVGFAAGLAVAYSNNSRPASVGNDPYRGWKTATSARAMFSFKYPADWAYKQEVGSKDNVEHITLVGSHFLINIDSYMGKDTALGGTSSTTCGNCQSSLDEETFVAGLAGKISLETITYSLDGGSGNALILRQNGIYYIPSPTTAGATTTYRGFSRLDSVQVYQRETPEQFQANPQLTTARKILKSVRY